MPYGVTDGAGCATVAASLAVGAATGFAGVVVGVGAVTVSKSVASAAKVAAVGDEELTTSGGAAGE